jgi:hypothetical protein
MILVLPFTGGSSVQWKIWILSTYLEDLDLHPENEALLWKPGRDLKGVEIVDSDVLIIGAGNAYVVQRLCIVCVYHADLHLAELWHLLRVSKL